MAGSSSLGRQFRATHTWNVLVLHLKENANIKKRRNLKRYDECFSGANAVDVLHQFVKNRPQQFRNATSISRENIVRLCQSFLDMSIVCRVMETDVDKLDKFEDSTTALYAFIDDQETNTTSNERQVLREIDGDIRNSLGHISISNKGFVSKHSSLTLRSKRRPHFPVFGGVNTHSSKESINQVDDSDGEIKVQHPLKRTSTLVRRVVKRSSSDPNLQKSTNEPSLSSENQEFKKKTGGARSSVRLRFSQRLSFRKKSFSSDTTSNSDDEVFKQASGERFSNASNCTASHLQEHSKIARTRRSLHDMTTKTAKSLRHKLSTPNLLSKMRHHSQTYSINEAQAEAGECSSTCLRSPSKRAAQNVADDSDILPKIPKLEFIQETPSRLKSCQKSFTNFASNMSIRAFPLRKSERGRKSEQPCVLANPRATESFEGDLASEKTNEKNSLTPQDIARVEKECVRVRLLQKLDLSFVDDVITSPNTSDFESQAGHDTDTATVYDEILTSFSSDDSWVSTALKILTQSCDNHETLRKIAEQESINSKKIQLYFAIYDYYKSTPCAILPNSLMDILPQIVRSLETKPISESLEVVQLFLHLLPKEKIQELQSLITFLHVVTSGDDVLISSKCSNKMLILQTFPGLIFPINDKLTPCDVTSGPSGLLQFLLENSSRVFLLPSVITAAVERKQRLFESGEIDSPTYMRDTTCSLIIPVEEFEAQKIEFTQKQIAELAKCVVEDPAMLPPRKKKDFLKKLQSSHLSAYASLRQPLKASHQLFSSSVETSKKLLKVPGTGSIVRRRSKKQGPVKQNTI